MVVVGGCGGGGVFTGSRDDGTFFVLGKLPLRGTNRRRLMAIRSVFFPNPSGFCYEKLSPRRESGADIKKLLLDGRLAQTAMARQERVG